MKSNINVKITIKKEQFLFLIELVQTIVMLTVIIMIIAIVTMIGMVIVSIKLTMQKKHARNINQAR